ncbi:hypothetical protein ATE67_09280 [Sphingopyxis sp. H050]|uniref:hypothetical protein n=1 Tax=Sphingopyxis sp. H050 TaxID=1759072 RepID=UPI000736D877|nr:hypothetical protein [Sphingopyxis sp. H050]KTE20447.1 hypothetical protein ATE67_09280 [Sphingopyxis sp. H050]
MTDVDKPAKRPMSRRRKCYLTALGLAGLFGGILGAWMQVAQSGGSASDLAMLSNGPLPTNFAIGASIIWVVGMILSLILYHRSVDDHEERAYLWAGTAAWYTITLAGPTWWVLHRASLAPTPDLMLVFVGALAVNLLVWLWLKYR